jgi:hypothetical protein
VKPEMHPFQRDHGDTVARRRVLTDSGRAALGLPPVSDVVLVPLLDLPARDDRRDQRQGATR